jgi:aminoglycoside phosphotransferase family enzyme
LEPTPAEKVAFLHQPGAYPDATDRVEVIETHFAWVFLSREFAYKLKKPLHFQSLDLTSLEARRRNCELELALNRRLARPTYLAVTPLAMRRSGMQLEGQGPAVDWLVKMRRLPEEKNLVVAARDRRVTACALRGLVAKLVRFYRTTATAPWQPRDYLDSLRNEILDYGRQLSAPELRTAAEGHERLAIALCEFLDRRETLLTARIAQRRVVDAHGDLRPEHIFLLDDPQIIDCLEFKPELRLLDSAAELAFLDLECERIEQESLGKAVMKLYRDIADDAADPRLLLFYRGVAALTRALVSAWHLPGLDPTLAESWVRKTAWYIEAGQASIDDALA